MAFLLYLSGLLSSYNIIVLIDDLLKEKKGFIYIAKDEKIRKLIFEINLIMLVQKYFMECHKMIKHKYFKLIFFDKIFDNEIKFWQKLLFLIYHIIFVQTKGVYLIMNLMTNWLCPFLLAKLSANTMTLSKNINIYVHWFNVLNMLCYNTGFIIYCAWLLKEKLFVWTFHLINIL